MISDFISGNVRIEAFHSFTYFLGTSSGELLRRFIELIFYLIIIYMIFSEFRKNSKSEYKYLIVGFFALLGRQLFMCSILFGKIFGVINFNRFAVVILLIDQFLETLALLLLVAAFIFPAFKHIKLKFQKIVLLSFYSIALIVFSTYILYKAGYLGENSQILFLNIIQIAVLVAPYFFLWKGRPHNIKYLKSIMLALFIYLLIPLISLISLSIFGYLDPRLMVIQHPLPFISILILMRSVYLTLVDKAFLRTELEKSKESLEHERELSKLKDHFISIVSHELRTPITSIKLYLSLLKQAKFGTVSSSQENAIKTVINEVNRLSDLIDNLLTITKIEAHKLVLEKSDFNIKELADELYIGIADNKGIRVYNKLKSFIVHADRNRLKQVYINLMSNAIKFSQKGGSITLASGRKGNEWYFSVKDAGIGISKDEIPLLFDKFYQVDNTLERKNQGIGLGLAIVKHIVELHKGRVEVKSNLGKGSEFIVWIPI